MMPISKIKVGDQYANPLYNDGLSRVIFVVQEINYKEKMVLVQGYSEYGDIVGRPFWKKNTYRMFSESWKIWEGRY